MKWDVRYAPSQAAEEEPTLPQSVVVGNVVFVSGCTCARRASSRPAGSRIRSSSRSRARGAPSRQAGSGMDNIVKTFFLLTSLDDYGRVRKTETEFYERYAPQLVTTPPAATLMVVPSLARPELLVQYEVDRCARPRHARLGSDVLPGVLGREGARLPARARKSTRSSRGASRSEICSSSRAVRRSITTR